MASILTVPLTCIFVTAATLLYKHVIVNEHMQIGSWLPLLIGACTKSCRFARECVLFVYCIAQLEWCLHKQTQIVANTIFKVGYQQFLSLLLVSFYCDPYFLYFNYNNLFLVQFNKYCTIQNFVGSQGENFGEIAHCRKLADNILANAQIKLKI